MITQFDVSTCLVEQLPEIRTDLNFSYPTLNIFRTIRCLVNHTRSKLEQHDMQGVKNCLDTAEYIYARGNNPVKNVMENIFIPSFSSLFSMGSSDERKELQTLMPLHLYCAYVKRLI
ncbi:MAG: hypothetical protein ABIT05_16655 [Chitinophagaceae bacterium]